MKARLKRPKSWGLFRLNRETPRMESAVEEEWVGMSGRISLSARRAVRSSKRGGHHNVKHGLKILSMAQNAG